MSWRAKLEARRAENIPERPDGVLTEPPKGGFGSFGSTQDGHSGKMQGADVPAQRARLLALAADEGRPAGLVHGLDDGDVAACGPYSDAELRDCLRALAARERMDAGMVPLEWGEPVARTCGGCGLVMLWRDCPAVVKACPWCFRRAAGKPIPRACTACGGGPGTHRCAACYPRENLPTLSGLVERGRPCP